jgi:hypothetical protein
MGFKVRKYWLNFHCLKCILYFGHDGLCRALAKLFRVPLNGHIVDARTNTNQPCYFLYQGAKEFLYITFLLYIDGKVFFKTDIII